MVKESDKGSAQLHLLKEINEAVNRGVPLNEILQRAVEGVAAIFGYTACDIHLLEDDNTLRYSNLAIDSKIARAVERLTGLTIIGYRIPLFEGSRFKQVIETGRPVRMEDMRKVFEDFTDKPRLKKFAPAVAKITGFKEALRVPMRSNNRVIGVLGAATKGIISDADVEALELFSSHLAGVIERRETETALRVSEEKYRSIVEKSHTGIYIIQDNRFKFVNEKLCEITGYSREELIGMDFTRLIAPESRHIIRESFRRQRGEAGPARVELKAFTKSGEKRDAITYSVPVEYQGHPAVQGNLIDITDLRSAETRIKALKEFSENIIESSPIAVYVIDRDCIVQSWNRLCETYTGVKKEDIIGKELFSVIPFFVELGWKEVYRDVIKGGVSFEKRGYKFNIRSGSRKGAVVYQNIKVAALMEKERVKGAITTIEDVSDLQQAQESMLNLMEELKETNTELEMANRQLLENDRLKSFFLAGVSHELRTPLNSIIGFTGMILQGYTGELELEQRKQLEIVYSNARHLLSLIEDLLDISSIEAGEARLEPEIFHMAEVVRDVLKSFEPKVMEKGLKLESTIADCFIKTDKRRFRQVLMNLIDNSVKFTDKGRITVKTGVEDGMIKVSIKDTGIGIKKEDLPLIFQSFYRVEKPIDPLQDGKGIGLYLCKRLINLLEGDIEAVSQYGRGSTFSFRIPAQLETEDRPVKPAGFI